MTQKPLSPAAQAVKDAVLGTYMAELRNAGVWNLEREGAVAAIRAVADQLLPELPLPVDDDTPEAKIRIELWDKRQQDRVSPLAIADELEDHEE
jgi:hypothetical protein